MSMGSQRISMVLIAALLGATASTVLAQGRLPTFRIMMIADGESPVFQQREVLDREQFHSPESTAFRGGGKGEGDAPPEKLASPPSCGDNSEQAMALLPNPVSSPFLP